MAAPSKKPTLTCAAASVLIAAAAIVGGLGKTGIAQEIWHLRVTGYGAFAFLAFALLATPAKLTLNFFRPGCVKPAAILRWRRALGITSACLALAHGTTAVATYLSWSWPTIFATPYLRAGLVAATILAALLVTSSPAIVNRFHIRFWKHLHRLAYIAALFVLQHTLLAPFSDRFWIASLFIALFILSLLRFLPKNPPSTTPESDPTITTIS